MLPSCIDSSPPLHQISKSPTHVLNTCQKPCGLIAPALTEPIWIIQQLWNRKIDWDKLLPSDLTKLADIHNITLDRWYRSIDTDTELHVFADASKIAYSIACYIRFKVNNQPNTVLLCQNPLAKSTCTTSCPDCIMFKTKNYKGIQNTNKRNLYVNRFKNKSYIIYKMKTVILEFM